MILVVAGQGPDAVRRLLGRTGAFRAQLHGDEEPAVVEALCGAAFQAVRIGTAEDVARAREYASDPLLLDARSKRGSGGTGETFDWSLAVDVAAERPVLLAGGLHPGNVASAVREVRPRGVDVASGVEVPGDPRRKSAERMAEFVAAARSASAAT